MFTSGCGLRAFVTFVEPLVQKHAAALRERAGSFLFKTHNHPFAVSDLDGVRFRHGFIEKTNLIFDCLLIDPDLELPEQLIEGEFDLVAFHFSYFQTEFHNTRQD